MKDKIRDYIGRHGRISYRQSNQNSFKRTNLILNDDGVFVNPPPNTEHKIILYNNDPVIVLQKFVGFWSLYAILVPKGIAWISCFDVELDDKSLLSDFYQIS